MSKEKVQEILSHVDMTKIDLTSFKISEKKFNELATLYRNRVVISCTTIILRKDQHPKEEVDVAFEMLEKVVNNPNLYSYSHIYSMERKAVDQAINDITSRRDRNINDVKVKAIERRMKDAYKKMRKTIELALDHDNDFEQEFDETTVERCLKVSQDAMENAKKKAAEKAMQEAQAEIDSIKLKVAVEYEARTAQNKALQILRETPTDVASKVKTKNRIGSFWKRIFGKVTM